MPNPLAVLGSETKALVRRISFAPTGTASNVGMWSNGPVSLINTGVIADGPLDFEKLVGDPLTNSVVAACINAITQALPDAPPKLERRVSSDDTKDNWEQVSRHPLLDLLNNPNPYLSSTDIWGMTAAYERTRGQAFWYLAYDGTTPREIWVWPTERVRIEGSADEPISGYTLTGETGNQVPVENNEVIHFRNAPSLMNWRLGTTPLNAGHRQITGDTAAAEYHSAILRNAGVLSLLVSLKDSAAASEVTPGQLEDYLQKLKRKLSGGGAGAMAGLDLPLDVHKIGYSPDEMALDKLINYYESRICALIGVDPMVCGLGSGTMQKTYANLGEALNDFWERQIVPMLKRHASTLTAQLFPAFGMDASEWRLSFDTSTVPALQENVDLLFTRWVNVWKEGGCDLYTFQTRIGLPDVSQGYKERFAAAKPEQVNSGNQQTANGALKSFEESQHPRDSDGKFGSGGGAPALSEKAQKAKASHQLIDRTQQRYTEDYNEPKFAKAVGGESYPDSEPVDVVIKKDGKPQHGIEMKTMVSNKANKITMKTSAMQKKKAWQDETGGVYHTVVLDDQKVFQANGKVGSLNPGDSGYADLHDESQRQMYYRRGAGSFRVDGMHPVKDMAELKTLMNMPDEALPKAAKPSKTWLELEGVASKRPAK